MLATLFLVVSLVGSSSSMQSQSGPRLLVNADFRDGLKGWRVEGKVTAQAPGVLFGAGTGAIRQRYEVPGLRILWFGANLKPSADDVKADIRLQCFDEKGRKLMDLTAGPDPKKGAAIYLKTHAFTKYVVLSIEKRSSGGSLSADNVLLQDDDRNRIEHAPEVDLDAYMKPIWEGDTVLNESVLLLAIKGSAPTGRLMFSPTQILSVKDSSLKSEYGEGRDYTVEGNLIRAKAGSSIPVMSDSELSKEAFPWTDLAGRHVFVSYTHKDKWPGPVPTYQGDLLPGTMAKLRGGKALTAVAYGDSITLGINVSGFRNVPPYMPTWASLFVRQLGIRYRNKNIKLYNTALGGMLSYWAKDNAKDAVASLHPDLVLIAFGMNDFWSLTPKEFAQNIRDAMSIVRAKNPKVEFILVASMKFDPDYTSDPTYVGNLSGYAEELSRMAGSGVAFFNMTLLSDALYKAKSQKDLGTDPMHPDDFLARWYAQGLFALLNEPRSQK